MRECYIDGVQVDLDDPPVGCIVETNSGNKALIVESSSEFADHKKGMVWFDKIDGKWSVSNIYQRVKTILKLKPKLTWAEVI